MTATAIAFDPDLLDRVRTRLVADGTPPTTTTVAAALRAERGGICGDVELLAVLRALQSEMVGAGPLEPLLRDPAATDVLVNGPDDVWVDRGDGLQPVGVQLGTEAAVRRLAQRLASAAGRRLDDAQPWVDARLPDGTRLHAVLPPIAAGGTAISLRTVRRRPFTLDELVEAGSLPADGAALLRRLVTARVAFLVSGGTGTGKTTLLSALLSVADPVERLVLVEDAGELRPALPHVVRLEARPPNVEGAGAVTLRDLVRQALRMRPDRLVVGEVRGAEVADLLAALNTGHEGGCGTVHANEAVDVPARLEALAAMAGMSRAALHSQLAPAVQAVVHLTRGRAGVRRVSSVCALRSTARGRVVAVPGVTFSAGAVFEGPAAAQLSRLLDR